MKTLLVTVMIAATALAGACGSKSNDVANDKQQFRNTMEAKLSEIDTKMNNLKDRIDYVSDESKAELQEQMAKLDAQRHDLANSLAQVENAGADQWTELKEDIESGYQDLEEGLASLTDRLDHDTSVGQM